MTLENNEKRLDGANAGITGDSSEFPRVESESAVTSLEFEFSENESAQHGPTFTSHADISLIDEERSAEPSAEVDDATSSDVVEEFSIPDSFVVNDKYASETFMETPSNLRTTYLPRFTEISDTYRMQDDPRPRPEKASTPVAGEVSADELGPTSESVEEREVEKVVVTTGSLQQTDLIDETMTVLKFSTPIDTETQDASAVVVPVTDQVPEQDAEVVEDDTDAADDAVQIEEKPKNMMVPDPDSSYRVIDFSKDASYADEAPDGAGEYASGSKCVRNEFTSSAQRDTVKDRFLDSLMSIKVRLVGALILLAATALLDVTLALGADILASTALGSLASARAFIDVQVSVCFYLLVIPETVGAFKLLAQKKCTPELFASASLVAILFNDIVIISKGMGDYLTLGLLYGIQCAGILAASLLKTSAVFMSFRIVSRNVGKNVLDRKFTRTLPRENRAVDGAVDEYSSRTARMFRTSFVSDFFARSSDSQENYFNTALMLCISFGAALLTGLVAFFVGSYSMVPAAQSFATVILLALPASSILLHKLSYSATCREAAGEDSAFIGERSVFDASEIDVFTYDDTEIFGVEDVSIRKVHLYGKAYNTPKAMRQMYSLFSAVGGPLDYVFSSSLDRKCPSATDIVIEDDGISGCFEGHTVSAGTEAYMLRHGISIPADDYRTNTSFADSTKVMYGSEDGEVYVKFFIRYSFSEEFTMLLPELKDKKIIPLVYTRDPNITNELIKVLTLGEDTMRVMKKYTLKTSELKTYRNISSGTVTHGDKTNLVNMVLLAKKYTAFHCSAVTAELAVMIAGAVLGAVLSLGGFLSTVTPVLALWQLLWIAVLIVRTRITFLKKKADIGSDEESDELE